MNEIPGLVFDFKVVFFFCSGSFLSPESPLNLEKHSVSSVEYLFFSVACLDSSVGLSSLEFKFRVEFLPYYFSSKISTKTYSLRNRPFLSTQRIPTLGFSTTFNSVSLARNGQTDCKSRFSTWLFFLASAEWSARCMTMW